MAISLTILYYIYLIMVGLFFIFGFFIIYHLLRFGYFGLGSLVMAGIFITVAVLILIFSWQYVSKINWQQPIETSNFLDNNNFSNF